MVNKKFKVKSAVALLFLLAPLIFQVFLVNLPEIKENDQILHTSYLVSSNSTQWVIDQDLDHAGYWTSSEGGDISDVDSAMGGGVVNMTVVGNVSTFSDISGTPQDADWTKTNDQRFQTYPDISDIDSYGCYFDHEWIDPNDPEQSPSTHWDRNITLPVDMSDYEIISVSLSATFNATVSSDAWGDGGIDIEGDTGFGNTEQFDYARFSIFFQDLSKNITEEAAYNQSTDLGQDSPSVLTYPDQEMYVKPEASLISYLTRVLDKDPEHRRFTLTLGIRVYCADNGGGDIDDWLDLRIKACNLSFIYQKKVDQLTNVKWGQDGNKLSDLSSEYIVTCTDANATFNYKIDKPWPFTLSPNSEIQILINNIPHSETIKLRDAGTSFQEGKIDGFDLTSLITEDIDISIRVLLKDDFILNESYTISIGYISLIIAYELSVLDPPLPRLEDYLWAVGLLTAGLVGVGGYFVAYELVFKFPSFVRQIRKLRKKVKKGKKLDSPITGESREKFLSAKLKEKMRILRIDIQSEGAGSMVSLRPSSGIMDKGGIQK